MTTYHYYQRARYYHFVAAVACMGIVGMMLLNYVPARAQTVGGRTTISRQLSIGSQGTDVRTLQTYLATNQLVYPQGIVSGFYGPLTANAVTQFQIAYGIPAVGRVGPMTLAKINSLLASGASLDVSSPSISNMRTTTTGSSATVSWNTSEPTYGSLHYDLVPLTVREVSTAHEVPQTSGTFAQDLVLGMSHTIMIAGLDPTKIYYLGTESRDVSGNITITLPLSVVFR